MFIYLPVMPPLVEGLPAPVMKRYRALIKNQDNINVGGGAHAIAYYALQARQVDGQFNTDAIENKKLFVELQLNSKALCEEINAFAVGPYLNAVSDYHNSEIEKLPVVKQVVFDGFTANGWIDNPGLRGSFERCWADRHETVRAQKEKIEYLYSILDACRQTARRNEETIARIDEKLARHKKTTLAL